MTFDHDQLGDFFIQFRQKLDAVRTLNDFLVWQDDIQTSGLLSDDGPTAAEGGPPLSRRSIPNRARALTTDDEKEPIFILLPSGEIAAWNQMLRKWVPLSL